MSSSAKADSSCDFSAALEQILGWVEQGFYPGAGLVIGWRGRVVLEHHFGAHDPGTADFIASASKWLAAATIAAVVDEGVLSWEDPVQRWLPEFTGSAGAVRLRQLLSHTSGLPGEQPEGRRNDDYPTLEESVRQVLPLPLLEPPGTRFRYGGLALQVAGRMAEQATGHSFPELFRRKLAQPLGLEHTRFTPVDPSPGHNPMLAGGARSCAVDYARFVAMIAGHGQLAGKRVLSDEAIAEMQRDQVGTASVGPGQFPERVRGATHQGVYGLGVWRERVDAQGNVTQLSSPSWAGAYPWVDLQRDVFGVLIAHVDLQGPPWTDGFNPFYSSAVLADLVAAAVDG